MVLHTPADYFVTAFFPVPIDQVIRDTHSARNETDVRHLALAAAVSYLAAALTQTQPSGGLLEVVYAPLPGTTWRYDEAPMFVEVLALSALVQPSSRPKVRQAFRRSETAEVGSSAAAMPSRACKPGTQYRRNS